MGSLSLSTLIRIYWVFVIIVVMAVVYRVSHSQQLTPGVTLQEPAAMPLINIRPNPAALIDANTALEHARSALAQPVAAIAEPATDGKAVSATNTRSAWQTGNSGAGNVQPGSMPLPEGIVTYEPVNLDMDGPMFPIAGEQLSLPLPGGLEVVANVESGHDNPNGDYTWRGHLDGYGNEYPVVMTYGGNSAFATITTPQGSYSLESVNGSGWVYKNPAEVELTAPGKNDYLEIPHTHKH